jgi:hypothetical protein
MAWAQAPLSVEGTEFVLSAPDGRVLRSSELTGAALNIGRAGSEIEITIESVEVVRQDTFSMKRRLTAGRISVMAVYALRSLCIDSYIHWSFHLIDRGSRLMND